MKTKLALAFTFYLTSICFVKAQWSIGLLGGYQRPLGHTAEETFINKSATAADFRSFSKGNIPVGISLKYTFGNKIGIYGDYHYLINVPERYLGVADITYSNNTHIFKLGGSYLFGNRKIRATIGLDGELFNWTIKTYVSVNGSGKDYNFETKSSFGIGGKLGMLYRLSNKMDLSATLNYTYILSSGTVNPKEANAKPLPFSDSKMIGLQVGIDYHFGK